jgi:Flp pilus assembly protein TadD
MTPQPTDRPGLAEACYQRGRQALERGQVEAASVLLRCAAALNPLCGRTWNDLGVTFEALGNRGDAAECYRRALAVQPARHEARQNLGLLTFQMMVSRASLPR